MERFQKSILPLVPGGHNPLQIAHAERERSPSSRFGEVLFIIGALREVDDISGFVQQLNIGTTGLVQRNIGQNWRIGREVRPRMNLPPGSIFTDEAQDQT
jgi:hypothetical protein